MRLVGLNQTPQFNSAKNSQSFGMNLEVKGSALSYYEKRLGEKLNVNKRLSEIKDGFEKLTNKIDGDAIIDLEQGSKESPELILKNIDGQSYKCNKYPASVTCSDILPDEGAEVASQYSMKRLINGAGRILSENGFGYKNENPFSEIIKTMNVGK